jgi:branched-chain amino acid transport system ATP-binding protein
MLLKVRDVETYYGNAQILKGISIEIGEGELVVVLGANGAGKTTLLRTISGLVKPRTGTIEFAGRRIDLLPPDAIVKLGISQCPEGRKLFPKMTVFKNLALGAYICREDKQKISESMGKVFEFFPILRARQQQLAGTLSGGEQQMLAIGRALMSKPKLLMPDEPSLGLAPLVVSSILNVIRDINQQGTTILLVEQNAAASLSIAHRGYVFETGKVALSDTANRLLIDEKVKQAYMGM